MPSTRRRFLQTWPVAALGIAGCSNVQPDTQDEKLTSTPSADSGSSLYEPTTPDTSESEPKEPPEYKVQTPATVRGWNHRNESLTVRVILEIGTSDDRNEVLNESIEFPKGTHTGIAEFEQHGQYHFTVEIGDERYSETVYVWPQQLADCNTVSPTIEFEPSGVSIGVWGTDAGCPPLTATPNSTEKEM